MAAIDKNAMAIGYIDNPDDEVQIAAVKNGQMSLQQLKISARKHNLLQYKAVINMLHILLTLIKKFKWKLLKMI